MADQVMIDEVERAASVFFMAYINCCHCHDTYMVNVYILKNNCYKSNKLNFSFIILMFGLYSMIFF